MLVQALALLGFGASTNIQAGHNIFLNNDFYDGTKLKMDGT
jgi:hypothetical protein